MGAEVRAEQEMDTSPGLHRVSSRTCPGPLCLDSRGPRLVWAGRRGPRGLQCPEPPIPGRVRAVLDPSEPAAVDGLLARRLGRVVPVAVNL